MQYEAVIIGAGIMGLCTAYYLNQGGMKRILVVDREPYFGGYNTTRCAGGLRYQFAESDAGNWEKSGNILSIESMWICVFHHRPAKGAILFGGLPFAEGAGCRSESVPGGRICSEGTTASV